MRDSVPGDGRWQCPGRRWPGSWAGSASGERSHPAEALPVTPPCLAATGCPPVAARTAPARARWRATKPCRAVRPSIHRDWRRRLRSRGIDRRTRYCRCRCESLGRRLRRPRRRWCTTAPTRPPQTRTAKRPGRTGFGDGPACPETCLCPALRVASSLKSPMATLVAGFTSLDLNLRTCSSEAPGSDGPGTGVADSPGRSRRRSSPRFLPNDLQKPLRGLIQSLDQAPDLVLHCRVGGI